MRGNELENHFMNHFDWPALKVRPVEYVHKIHQESVNYNLILSGRSQDIVAVLRMGAIEGLSPRPLNAIKFNDFLNKNLVERIPALKAYVNFEIRLYDLNLKNESEEYVWNVIGTLHDRAKAAKRVIFADPNLITGELDGSSPGGAVGGPVRAVGRAASEKSFIEHWAFQTYPGITLENGRGSGLMGEDQTGKGVTVFILDTCDPGIDAEIYQGKIKRNYPPQDFNLQISSPSGRYHADNQSRRLVQIKTGKEDEYVDEHGLFVAGLVHRVAPDSHIHLVDVLNKHGRGELYGLLQALSLLARHAASAPLSSAYLPLNRVIINLSLGATLSKKSAETKVHPLVNDFRHAVYGWNKPVSSLAMALLDDLVNHQLNIASLRLIVKFLYELGAVVVAAAGNESARVAGELLEQIPANYPEVIGVAASTFDGKKANFSNLGDIMAPGGGRAFPDIESENFNYETLPARKYTEQSIISVVPTSKYAEGFAYWRGTSFAAPLVSGLAALVIEKMIASQNPIHPKNIRELILRYAYGGVINAVTTLNGIRAPE